MTHGKAVQTLDAAISDEHPGGNSSEWSEWAVCCSYWSG